MSSSRPVLRGQEANAVGHLAHRARLGSLAETPGCSWGSSLNLVPTSSAGRTKVRLAELSCLRRAPKQSAPVLCAQRGSEPWPQSSHLRLPGLARVGLGHA